jgi:protein-disulfide isomerase
VSDTFLSSRAGLALVAIAAAVLGAGGTWIATRSVEQHDTGEAIRSYLLAHPDVIPEAMQKLQERETAKVIAQYHADIVKPLGSAWTGNPDGDVTVVEYLDFNCGYCRASLPLIDQLVAADPKVKVVYKELPVLSPESDTAARYAVVAARAGKYKQLHDALYKGGPLTEASMDSAIATAGLNPAQVKVAAKAPDVDGIIKDNLALMRPLNMTGTPTWVIGNRVISGMIPIEEMQAAVTAARGK